MEEQTEKKQNWFMRHKVITAILVLGVLVMFSGGGDTNTQDQAEQESEKVSEEVKEEPVQVSYEKVDTVELINAFDTNQLAAEKEYTGKNVELTAKINNISEDIVGSPFLSLHPTTADEYYFGTSLQCYFDSVDDLLTVANEQVVTIQGTMKEQTLGIIGLKKCKIIQ